MVPPVSVISAAGGWAGRSPDVPRAPTHHATTTARSTTRPGPTEADVASPAARPAAAMARTAASRVGTVDPDGRYRAGGWSSRRLVSSSGVSTRVIVAAAIGRWTWARLLRRRPGGVGE